MSTPEIQAARQKVDSLKAERDRLYADIAEHEKQVKAKQDRLRLVVGGWSNGGELQAAERDLAKLCRELDDKQLPIVIWAEADCWHNGRWVVTRITAKRIYVRAAGTDRQEQYLHDGTSPRQYDKTRIDIAATFPNGLKAEGK